LCKPAKTQQFLPSPKLKTIEKKLRRKLSSNPDRAMRETSLSSKSLRNLFRVGIPVLGLLGASLSMPRTALASSGSSFFETMGISIAVGTVLGASTLPFYDQPGKHLMNVGYGAGAGAVVGLGLLVRGWLSGTSDSEAGYACGAINENEMQGAGLDYKRGTGPQILSSRTSDSRRSVLGSGLETNRLSAPRTYSSASVWMPVVSLTW
jgi:hypothetical protein